MKLSRLFFILFLLAVVSFETPCLGAALADTQLTLKNEKVLFGLSIHGGKVSGTTLSLNRAWCLKLGVKEGSFETDADFGLEVMWTDWQAPKTVNNAENPIFFTKADFSIARCEEYAGGQGRKGIRIELNGNDFPLQVQLLYELGSSDNYIRKKIVVIDTARAGHFLQKTYPVREILPSAYHIVKAGGFGQPVALTFESHGFFAGLEYPAADNAIADSANGKHISCSQEMGMKISAEGVASEWVVEGISPDPEVKRWFMKYVDDIRVAPLKPYTLYNSWYDLRSADYPRVPEENKMNEQNIMRIIRLITENMIEKHKITLDAFVLDDGWDVYQSDWVLRPAQFPNGLKPIADQLKKTNTSLGLWFGPTGGYSFRMKRVNWMREHGYEVVGRTTNTAMLCLAGEKYSALFKKRTTDFVASDGVGYFKWDGIQFSCSEPDHGHPVGIYSRRAVMESVIDKCRSVRALNPNVFLNITSGTWLSPWWVKYANQIWMQGEDYGYADVPSISQRDAAITYRDLSLYEDFKTNDFWMPIQNLMTHGIIKGTLEKLGGEDEPLDKFTNEVLLYLARGVSMWELYISPDILSEGEWSAMGEAMHWAKDRFPVLSTTEMVGGDPKKREAYGYMHGRGTKAILAARNPWIEPSSLTVDLSPANGVDPDARDLVLERVYPTRWVSPRLYKAGERITVPLGGYETAIYEIAPRPQSGTGGGSSLLIAGAEIAAVTTDGNVCSYSLLPSAEPVKLMAGAQAGTLTVNGKAATVDKLQAALRKAWDGAPAVKGMLAGPPENFSAALDVQPDVQKAELAVLVAPTVDANGRSSPLPKIRLIIDGREDTAKYRKSEGSSAWFTVPVMAGKHEVRVVVERSAGADVWRGSLSVWVTGTVKRRLTEVSVATSSNIVDPPMPPAPFAIGVVPFNEKLGVIR